VFVVGGCVEVTLVVLPESLFGNGNFVALTSKMDGAMNICTASRQ
jgi:hypothetical protein